MLIDQACKHRLGLFAKVLSPLASFLRTRIWHARKRSSGLAGCVNNLVVKVTCAGRKINPHMALTQLPLMAGNLLLNPELSEKFQNSDQV